MIRLPRFLLILSVFLVVGCQDTLVEPDVAVSLAKGGIPGKPGGDDPPPDPGQDGRVWVFVGYPANEPTQAVSGARRSIVPIGATVTVPSTVMDIGYFGGLAGFAPCFPEALVRGDISLTEDAGTGRADFTFSAMAQDGATAIQYVLTLTGGTYSNAWPVPTGVTSAFDADTWTLTSSGKGKKRNGCTGTATFASSVLVELAHLSPTTVTPGTPPFLSSPFDLALSPPMPNPFDHTGAGDGLSVNFRGDTVSGADGHDGYDWVMPEGTELLAAADGEVAWVGVTAPFYCRGLGRIVNDNLVVGIQHIAPDGQRFGTLYQHMSRADVEAGDAVATGDVIGLSGNTGCSTTPHLHFSVPVWSPDALRFLTQYGATKVDPYGWTGTGEDPWLTRLEGALNQYLWLPGEVPDID